MQEDREGDFATTAGTIAGIVMTVGAYLLTFWPVIKQAIARY